MVSVPTGAEVAQFTNSLVAALLWILVALLVCGVLGIIAYRATFKVKVRLRHLTGSNDKIKDCVGKIVNDKVDGVQKLIVMPKLFKTFKMPAPPYAAVSINMRGKDSVEVEITPDGDMRYITKSKTDREYKPLDTNDKIFVLNEHEKIAARRKKGLSEFLTQALPYIVFLIMFIAIIAFWADITAPFNERMDASEQALNKRLEMELQAISMLKETIKEEQRVYGEAEVVNGVVPPATVGNAPPPPSNTTAPPE